jgi:hypothetical protein
MKGYNVSADTWEVAQSDAGQIVAKAVKEGKLSKEDAEVVLREAKAENWESMLVDGKLGILAALRNIRSILLAKSNSNTIDLLCKLISDPEAIRKGKIMPFQIDMANEVLLAEFSDSNARKISTALLKGYELALPNLADLLSGDTLVMVDFSGSMSSIVTDPTRKMRYKSSAMTKAALIAATIAKATNGDIIRFGSSAEYVSYNPNLDVFTLANSIKKEMGGTSLSMAWNCAKNSKKKYTRVFILSDNDIVLSISFKSSNPFIFNISFNFTDVENYLIRPLLLI